MRRKRQRKQEAKAQEREEKASAKSAAIEKYHQLSDEEKRKRVEHKRVRSCGKDKPDE